MRQGLSENLIARVLGSAPKYTIAQLEEIYPPRVLPDGAMVTRFAPSPTGFMHIGNLYGALIDKKLAQQSDGVFYLRIEDTDTEREVSGAVELIMGTQAEFGLFADEGPVFDEPYNWRDNGDYGPYFQSQRKDIYHSVAAELLATGRAYPCFLSSGEMDEIRAEQKAAGVPTGIYGEWAKWRNATDDEIGARLDANEIPTIRLYSTGDKNKKIFCKDAVRGSIAFPENDNDIVLIKSNDRLPTYHFAHLVDDHFMRTTHVVRSDEWLPSFPLHIQMFSMMVELFTNYSWAPPAYIHTSTLDTIDSETGKQRKLSKRKDPEANVDYFVKKGYPSWAVLDYLLNIISSGYEGERAKTPKLMWDEYQINIKKIPTSGALFDWKKMEWWSRENIALLSAEELYDNIKRWNDGGIIPMTTRKTGNNITTGYSRQVSPKTLFVIENKDDLIKIFGIERENVDNPKRIRKDFVTWKQTLEEVAYFFDDLFAKSGDEINKDALREFLGSYDSKDPKDLWWEKIIAVAAKLGIKNGDVAMALRIALTGRTNAPDLYSVMQVMGDVRVRTRIEQCLK